MLRSAQFLSFVLTGLAVTCRAADCPSGYVSTTQQIEIAPTVFATQGNAILASSTPKLVVGTTTSAYAMATATGIWLPPLKLSAVMNVPKNVLGSIMLLDANAVTETCPLLEVTYVPDTTYGKIGSTLR